MTDLTLNRAFKTYVERSERVIKVAEAFGIGLEDKEWTVYENLALSVEQGEVIYVTGQSGSGKSCLLRDIAAGLADAGKRVTRIEDVPMDDRPIIDQLGRDMTEATRLLAQAGISDAYLFIRKPAELSDGQRYRFRLAKLLESDADVWVADEFGAVLDRTTAKCVAFNFQKVARKHGKTVVVATTHDDLVSELAPSLLITKRFQDRIDVRGRLMLTIKAEGSAGVSIRDDILPDMIRLAQRTGCRVELKANDTHFFCRPDDTLRNFQDAYDRCFLKHPSKLVFPGMADPREPR